MISSKAMIIILSFVLLLNVWKKQNSMPWAQSADEYLRIFIDNVAKQVNNNASYIKLSLLTLLAPCSFISYQIMFVSCVLSFLSYTVIDRSKNVWKNVSHHPMNIFTYAVNFTYLFQFENS